MPAGSRRRGSRPWFALGAFAGDAEVDDVSHAMFDGLPELATPVDATAIRANCADTVTSCRSAAWISVRELLDAMWRIGMITARHDFAGWASRRIESASIDAKLCADRRASAGTHHALRPDQPVELLRRSDGRAGSLPRAASCRSCARPWRSPPPCRSRSSGASAVTSISERSISSRMRASLASMPATQLSVNERAASASSRIDCSMQCAITGLKTLSSKWPWLAADGDRGLIADHLAAHHGQRLALRRVDLAGHDRGAGLVLRQHQLAEAGARAGAEQADVVGDLEQVGGERVERAVREHVGVVRRQRLELVRRGDERQPGERGDLLRERLGELRLGVEAGADRGAALRQRIELLAARAACARCRSSTCAA